MSSSIAIYAGDTKSMVCFVYNSDNHSSMVQRISPLPQASRWLFQRWTMRYSLAPSSQTPGLFDRCRRRLGEETGLRRVSTDVIGTHSQHIVGEQDSTSPPSCQSLSRVSATTARGDVLGVTTGNRQGRGHDVCSQHLFRTCPLHAENASWRLATARKNQQKRRSTPGSVCLWWGSASRGTPRGEKEEGPVLLGRARRISTIAPRSRRSTLGWAQTALILPGLCKASSH